MRYVDIVIIKKNCKLKPAISAGIVTSIRTRKKCIIKLLNNHLILIFKMYFVQKSVK